MTLDSANPRMRSGVIVAILVPFIFECMPAMADNSAPDTAASSDELAQAWRPYVETCIEAFGPQRAMFESNFPVDKVYCSYGILWNAFKKLTAAYSAAEKAGLFFNTAKRTYRLPTTADASALQER